MAIELLVEVKQINIRIEEEVPESHVLLARCYPQSSQPYHFNLTKRPSGLIQNACKSCLGQSPWEAQVPRISIITQTFSPKWPGTSPICAHFPSFMNSPNPSPNPGFILSHGPNNYFHILALTETWLFLGDCGSQPSQVQAFLSHIPHTTGPGGRVGTSLAPHCHVQAIFSPSSLKIKTEHTSFEARRLY